MFSSLFIALIASVLGFRAVLAANFTPEHPNGLYRIDERDEPVLLQAWNATTQDDLMTATPVRDVDRATRTKRQALPSGSLSCGTDTLNYFDVASTRLAAETWCGPGDGKGTGASLNS